MLIEFSVNCLIMACCAAADGINRYHQWLADIFDSALFKFFSTLLIYPPPMNEDISSVLVH